MVIAYAFSKLQTVKILAGPLSKNRVSEDALNVNMWKYPKYLRNLHQSTFIIFFHHSDGSWLGKCLPYS